MKNVNTCFAILTITLNIIVFLSCDPEGDSFFDQPYPEGFLPEIPNEPGFYVNGDNKGILLFNDIVDWINKNVTNGAVYGIVLHQNIAINPVTFSYPGKNIYIILKGNTEGRTLSLARQGALITIGEGVTFGLSSNIELRGIPDNNGPLVTVQYKGTLIMDDGIISGNTNNVNVGGGVSVGRGAMFIMNGGKIINNKVIRGQAEGGGGVCVGGTFKMNGGEIENNIFTTSTGTGNVAYGGGGVYVWSIYKVGDFTMNGGKIINNQALGGQGGGILFTGDGHFSITGGEIGNNSATNDGGGIFRGGVSVGSGKTGLIIEGGIIFGNYAGGRGGGVCGGSFIKKPTGGIIYGDNAEQELRNTAAQGGSAVYINETKKRNMTVGEYVGLNSSTLAEWE